MPGIWSRPRRPDGTNAQPCPAPAAARHPRRRTAGAVLRPLGGGRRQHRHRLFRCPPERRDADARHRISRCRYCPPGLDPRPRGTSAGWHRSGPGSCPRSRILQCGSRRQWHPALQRQGRRCGLPLAWPAQERRPALRARSQRRRPGTRRGLGRAAPAGRTEPADRRQHRCGHEKPAHDPGAHLRTRSRR
ncbi:hypothetical protein D9M71_279360 [compost metagenome]